MRSKVVCILVCMMLITIIPIAAGMNIKNKPVSQISDVLAKTTIRGIVLFPKISPDGKTINFFAIRLHFRTIDIDGINYGVVKLHYFQIPKNFNGYFGNYYIFGSFRGKLNI